MVDKELLLSLYDVLDPSRPGVVSKGYDRDHASRTSAIAMKVARRLGVPEDILPDFEITCLLHDLSRVGLDQEVFANLFSLAMRRGVPTRPRELRHAFPAVRYGNEAEAFADVMAIIMDEEGIELTPQMMEHIEMRLGSKARLGRIIEQYSTRLNSYGVILKPWMTAVILYYYYPEELNDYPEAIKMLGRILVTSEQFEACNNRERGRDYYLREKETLTQTFNHLEALIDEGVISDTEVRALNYIVGQGELDEVIFEARDMPSGSTLPEEDMALVKRLSQTLRMKDDF